MLCKKPFIKDNIPFGCGQCLPCRINRRRLWTTRLILESYDHVNNSFVTLTYNQENLPEGATLVPRDVQLFMKRLRKHVYPKKLRFYAVGEYGDQTQRPHYHLVLFGYPPCVYGNIKHRKACNCSSCAPINKAWGKGHIVNGTLTLDSAQYVCGYVTKKMTNAKNEEVQKYLNGRYPEFCRMSNRPGIGANSLDGIIETLESEHGCDAMAELGDVPTEIAIGKKKMPLGRYLREKLREAMDWNETKTPKEVMSNLSEEHKEEMSKLFKDEEGNWKIGYSNYDNRKRGYKRHLIEQNKQKVTNIERKFKIFSTAKEL